MLQVYPQGYIQGRIKFVRVLVRAYEYDYRFIYHYNIFMFLLLFMLSQPPLAAIDGGVKQLFTGLSPFDRILGPAAVMINPLTKAETG